jgi:nucleotide-binding universal stress UspA family protein
VSTAKNIPTSHGPSVLCPVDFSDNSRAALRYATAVANHFGAQLTVLSVDDPLLAEAAATTGLVPSLGAETSRELSRFYGETLPSSSEGPKPVHFRVAVGKPAPEILRVAQQLEADLIVMSSHGRSGIRKIFFGSTTERVLRETTRPVLITPADGGPTAGLSEIARQINHVVAPVDLSADSPAQLAVAGGIAKALGVPLIVVNVLEPIFAAREARLAIPGVETARRTYAEEKLTAIGSSIPADVRTETIVLTGDVSEEIVKLAEARRGNLIVMGLHSSGFLGPRMGSVTYRVLCLTHALVLALPPKDSVAADRRGKVRLKPHTATGSLKPDTTTGSPG